MMVPKYQPPSTCARYQQLAAWLLVWLGVCLNPSPAVAAAFSIPDLTGPVIDDGGFFSQREAELLSRSLRTLRSVGGPQVQVWTMPSLRGFAIEELTIKAAEKWKLGDAEKDDGLILALAARERRMRIEVAYGLEGVIPDVIAARHISGLLRPALRAGQAARGVQAWLNEVAGLTLNAEQKSQWLEASSAGAKELSRVTGRRGPSVFLQIAFLIIVGLVVLGNCFLLPFLGIPRRRGFTGHWGGPGGGWGSGSGGWGGGSGGGWSGGGGGFGGGGSSGGW